MSLLALFAASAVTAAAFGPPRIYSDLCSETQTGDVSGHQIVLSGSWRNPKVKFFWTEGAIMMPLNATVVSLRGRGIEIVVRGPEGVAKLDGRLDARYLRGRVRDFGQVDWRPVVLRRYGVQVQAPPPCYEQPKLN